MSNQTNGLKLITDAPELIKAITAWGARGKKWADEGHMLAMSALTLMSKHNDVGPVNRLYLAMPKGTKSSAMVSWLLAYGAVVANEGEDKKDKPLKYTKDKEYKLAAAAKDPWFNHKPEPEADAVYDLAKAIEQVINKAKGKQLVNGELLSGLQGLMTVINTQKQTAAEVLAGDDEEPQAE